MQYNRKLLFEGIARVDLARICWSRVRCEVDEVAHVGAKGVGRCRCGLRVLGEKQAESIVDCVLRATY